LNLFATRLPAWLATCFGLGRFPVAPGTFTSAVATLGAIPLVLLGWKVLMLALCVVTVVGIPVCGSYARSTRIHDPSDCVLDEVAGQWLAILPAALAARGDRWPVYVVAFFAFRFFDIWKPWPVWWAERLPGGAGIVADDIFAGAYAAVIVFGLLWAGWV
jgi:phosphatidylglycerophosphatase A